MTLNSDSPRFASVTGGHWPGYDELKKMFIFGDSYSSVGYDTSSPAPREGEPLGVPFPGTTWTEGGESDFGDSKNPNWVGHLLMWRIKDMKPLLVYDYAVGGHTLSGVQSQVDRWFLPHAGKKPDWAPWSSEDSLFVTWVGINDCAYSSTHELDLKRYFELQEKLYEHGARNFLLIDVPPIQQSPAVSTALESKAVSTYTNWNDNLHKSAKAFHATHPEITLLMYSSWDIFDKVYQNPAEYGFSKADLKRRGGAIWMDHLHPTSKMHKVVAEDLEAFLKSFPSYKGE